MQIKELKYNTESLSRIADGDQEAFSLFFYHYEERVYNIAYSFLQSETIAEDVVQDVFLKVWKSRHQLSSIEFPDAWIATITRNHAINCLRMVARQANLKQAYKEYLPITQNNHMNPLEHKDLEDALHEAVGRLPDNQRLVFKLSQQEGMKREEIAAMMKISPNTVKIHLLRANKSIRAMLAVKLDYVVLMLLYWHVYSFFLNYFISM